MKLNRIFVLASLILSLAAAPALLAEVEALDVEPSDAKFGFDFDPAGVTVWLAEVEALDVKPSAAKIGFGFDPAGVTVR